MGSSEAEWENAGSYKYAHHLIWNITPEVCIFIPCYKSETTVELL